MGRPIWLHFVQSADKTNVRRWDVLSADVPSADRTKSPQMGLPICRRSRLQTGHVRRWAVSSAGSPVCRRDALPDGPENLHSYISKARNTCHHFHQSEVGIGKWLVYCNPLEYSLLAGAWTLICSACLSYVLVLTCLQSPLSDHLSPPPPPLLQRYEALSRSDEDYNQIKSLHFLNINTSHRYHL